MAMTNWYVDPASGNDTTGDGTIGTPWKSVQKALNTITRNSTDGDQINVKAGAADTLTATLTLATYGSPTAAAPLVFRGYTSTADDGGIGEIDGAATYTIYDAVANGNKDAINFWDMKIGNCGAATILKTYRYANIINCEIHSSSADAAVYFANAANRVMNCLFHSITGNVNVRADSDIAIAYCTFRSTSAGNVLLISNLSSVVANCVFDISTDTVFNAIRASTGCILLNNTIYSAAANTAQLVYVTGAVGGIAINNVVVGSSGAGGVGIRIDTPYTIWGGNAYYNNTTPESFTGKVAYSVQTAVALSGAPFVDAANDDFRITTDSDAIEAAWPSAMRSMASTTNAADIGAVQRGAGSGGGIIRRVMRILGG